MSLHSPRLLLTPSVSLFVLLIVVFASSAWAALPVRLALQWQPQSQFAGYYMAQKKGFYREAGLTVTLLHGDIERSSRAMLADGSADAGSLMLADAIVAAQAGAADTAATQVSLRQLSQLFQHSLLTLVAWKDMGIERPEDLNGRPVSLWQGSFSLAYEAFLRKHGASPVRIPQYGSVQLFLQRGVVAAAAMEYNELNRLYLAGIDADRLTVFRMRDFGLGMPEDGLYARADWAARHPQAARALSQATLRGWEYARQHPEETLDTVLELAEKAGVVTNRAHERWMLKTVLAAIFVDGAAPDAVGRIDPDMYARAVRSLREAGLIDAAAVPALADFQLPHGNTP